MARGKNIERYKPTLIDNSPAIVNDERVQTLGTLADRLRAFSDREFTRLERRRTEEGFKAGQKAQGNQTKLAETSGDQDAYSRAFREGVHAQHRASVRLDVAENVDRLERENEHDPEGFSLLTQKYADGLRRESPELAHEIDLEVRAKAGAAHRRLMKKFQNRVDSENQATVDRGLVDIEKDIRIAARDNNEQILFEKLEQYENEIDAAVNSGLKSPQQAEKEKRQLRRDIDTQSFTGEFDRVIEKEGYEEGLKRLNKFRKEKTPDLDPNQKDFIIARMESRLAKERARLSFEKSQRDAALRAREKRVAQDLKNLKSMQEAGIDPDPDYLERVLRDSEGTKHEGTAKELFGRSLVLAQFTQMSLQQQEKTLNKLRDEVRENPTGHSARMLISLESSKRKIESELNKDAMAFAIKQKRVDVAPIDWGDSNSIIIGLDERVSEARKASIAYGRDVPPLTELESEQMLSVLRNSTVDEQLQFLNPVVDGLGENANDVLAQLDKKKGVVYAEAGKAMLDGYPGAARDILNGNALLQENPESIPSKAAFNQAADAKLKTAYPTTEAGQKAKANHKVAARAIYASLAQRDNANSSVIDDELLGEALAMAGGEVAHVDPNFSNPGFDVVLPRGWDEDRFEEWVDGLTVHDLEQGGGVMLGDEIGMEEALNQVKNEGRFVRVGPGRYAVFIGQQPLNAKTVTEENYGKLILEAQ